jgi:redox-sensitive bicupin YhaK (pirin superfamily)
LNVVPRPGSLFTPIDEPVVGCGPFVMNTEREIRQAIEDYRHGRMGHLD